MVIPPEPEIPIFGIVGKGWAIALSAIQESAIARQTPSSYWSHYPANCS
ncbi:hypothetical protein [Leptolyngbya sp. AN02str]